MTVEFAIPSHARAARLAQKTIPFLHAMEVEPERIKVFVDPPERDEYLDALGWNGVEVVDGAPGVHGNRNRILESYPKGAHVVQVDDDVTRLYRRESEKRMRPFTPFDFRDLLNAGFRACQEHGARLWGVYPVRNPMFMKDRIRTDLTYIIGAFMGYVSDPAPQSPLRVTLEDKEDFERSLQCYEADRTLVRVEWAAIHHDFYKGDGGLNGSRTPERVDESARELVRRFPGLAHLNTSKRSGWTEVRLRDARPPAGHRGVSARRARLF